MKQFLILTTLLLLAPTSSFSFNKDLPDNFDQCNDVETCRKEIELITEFHKMTTDLQGKIINDQKKQIESQQKSIEKQNEIIAIQDKIIENTKTIGNNDVEMQKNKLLMIGAAIGAFVGVVLSGAAFLAWCSGIKFR